MAAIELYSTPLFNDANLVSYYRLEGNSNDSKGSNNGTDTNITYSSGNGKFNQGAGFNGSSSKIRLPSTFPDFGTGGFTISAWVKTSSATSQDIFFRQDNSSHQAIIEFNINSSGILNATVRGTEGNISTPTGSGAIKDGVFHHVVLVSTGSGGTVYIYKDGSQNASASIGTSTLNFGSAVPAFGEVYQGWIPSEGNWFNGAIDDMAIFSRALSATEVSNLYNGTWGNSTNFLSFM